MARIPQLDRTTLSVEQARIYDAIASGPRGGVRGPLAVWLHRPGLADTAQELGRYCRYDTSLPPRLSELAILVTARIWDAGYEWDAHVPHAQKAGISDEVIAALAADEEPQFGEADASIVYRVSRTLNTERKIPDQLYAEALECLGQDALIDLIGVLGYYSLISMTINAFEVDRLKQI